MKKIIFSVAVIAAATFGVIKANQNTINLSDLQMENVEALAQSAEAFGLPWCCHLWGICKSDKKGPTLSFGSY